MYDPLLDKYRYTIATTEEERDGGDDDTNSFQLNSFIYVLDNSQVRPITAKYKNNSTVF
jgi:hypothetical protein